MASSNPALRPLTLPPDFARLAQQERDEALAAQNVAEGQPSAGEMIKAVTGGMGNEDWSMNEKGELINEEGLPMFDIHEEIPAVPTASSSSTSSSSATAAAIVDEGAKAKPKMRYLVKKGGRTVVRSLPDRPSSSTVTPSTTSKSVVQPTPAPTAPSASTSSPAPSAASPAAADPSQPGPLSAQDVQSLLDELEAEEEEERHKAEAEAAAQAAQAASNSVAKTVEEAVVVPSLASTSVPATTSPAASGASKAKPASAFAGFSSGFLSSGKIQKRPSNSLNAPSTSTSRPSPSLSAAPLTASSAMATASSATSTESLPPTSSATKPLKSALSRPSSPSPGKRSIFDKPPEKDKEKKEKKSVAWDMSEAEEWKGERVASRAGERGEDGERKPIILGMGNEEVEEVKTPGVVSGVVEKPSTPTTPKPAAPVERPIKDQVVERPMKKPVAPGGGAGAEGVKKRVSKFRKAKEEMTASRAVEEYEGKGKGKAREEPLSPRVGGEALPPSPSAFSASDPTILGPIHTISLSSKPTASSSSGTRAPQNGTISYADIPFDEDEDDPDLDPSDSDEDGWVYSDDDEEDEDFDVDAALHQREVALLYHQQRMRVGAGKGTGALGGWHGEGEGVWEGVGLGRGNEEEEGIVPADATLQSLTPDASISSSTFGTYPGAGSAQEGRPSRFRQSNRHLESAQMIIPSLLAADPTLVSSHTPLGPALGSEQDEAGTDSDPDGFAPAERERLRRTLAALAAGETLPEDEQKEEAEKEVRLRGEWAREKAEREKREKERRERERREGGKAPPVLASAFKPQDPTAMVQQQPEQEQEAPDTGEKTQEEELAELLMGASVEEPAVTEMQPAPAPVAEASGGKKLSRFRQKQLGLID
ncbi:hypothetical protein JCM11251_005270 [Rhodosporidiobolus azoricus]